MQHLVEALVALGHAGLHVAGDHAVPGLDGGYTLCPRSRVRPLPRSSKRHATRCSRRPGSPRTRRSGWRTRSSRTTWKTPLKAYSSPCRRGGCIGSRRRCGSRSARCPSRSRGASHCLTRSGSGGRGRPRRPGASNSRSNSMNGTPSGAVMVTGVGHGVSSWCRWRRLRVPAPCDGVEQRVQAPELLLVDQPVLVDPGGERLELGRIEVHRSALGVPASGDQPGLLEHLNVLGHRLFGDLERFGQFVDRRRARLRRAMIRRRTGSARAVNARSSRSSAEGSTITYQPFP